MNDTVHLAVVCEGATDIPVLNAIASGFNKKNNTAVELVVVKPQTDATTGKIENFGWTNIRSWCMSSVVKSSGNEIALAMGMNIAKLDEGKLAETWKNRITSIACSALLIVMDTDIAEKIDEDGHGPIINGQQKHFNPQTDSRQDYCRESIEHWIGEPENERLKFVLPTESIETWLLAFHCRSTLSCHFPSRKKNYESIKDPYGVLRSLGCKLGKKKSKDTKKYEEVSKQFEKSLCPPVKRCKELLSYVKILKKYSR